MNILVTGGAGFIASAIVRQLVQSQRGLVVNVDKLTYASDLERLKDVENKSNYHFVKADICDQATLGNLLKTYQIDAVIHAAAETHVDNSIQSPDIFLNNNVVGTYRILEAVRAYLEDWPSEKKKEFRFLQISTDEVYGDLLGLDKAKETSPYKPSSPYSASKAAADHFVTSWGRTYKIPTLITHSANNYGFSQNKEKLIPKVISSILEQQAIPVFGSGRQVRDWIHVEDNARGVIMVLDKGISGESYNISAENEVENLNLINLLCDLVDEYIKPLINIEPFLTRQLIEHVKDRPGHDIRYAMDSSKVLKLGWEPKISFQEGLEITVASALKKEKF